MVLTANPNAVTDVGLLSVLGDVATWVGSLGALGTGIVATVLAVSLSRREKRQLMASSHHDLTTGEVAEARHLIGSVLHSKRDLAKKDSEPALRALFILYWAVERAENLNRALGKGGRKLQREFLLYNLNEMVNNIIVFRNRYRTKFEIADDESWSALEGAVQRVDQGLWEEFYEGNREHELNDPL